MDYGIIEKNGYETVTAWYNFPKLPKKRDSDGVGGGHRG
jgi:hypothetical protein